MGEPQLAPDRPPLPGAPWLLPAPPRPGTARPAPRPRQLPPLDVGPPFPGAPWAFSLPGPLSSASQVVLPSPQSRIPPLLSGPPVDGAPWLYASVGSLPTTTPSRPPVSPPVPSTRAGTTKPFIPRDVPADPRQRRFTEVLSSFFNSMLAQGVIYQVDASKWAIDVGAAAAAGGVTMGATGDGRIPGHYGV